MNLADLLPSLSPEKIAQLERLADLFLTWNERMNLSSYRTPEQVLLKHIVDSLLVLKYQLIAPGMRVLDLGTGGGFPGLALAIAYPETNFVLVDATEKKMMAVQAMVNALKLGNVKCLTGRAEELGHQAELREQFDVVVARALALFPTLLEYCLPFVKVGGTFVAYQGPEMMDSWQRYSSVAEQLSSEIQDVLIAHLPVENAVRCFILVEKSRPIDQQFPRRVGIPKLRPLR